MSRVLNKTGSEYRTVVYARATQSFENVWLRLHTPQ